LTGHKVAIKIPNRNKIKNVTWKWKKKVWSFSISLTFSILFSVIFFVYVQKHICGDGICGTWRALWLHSTKIWSSQLMGSWFMVQLKIKQKNPGTVTQRRQNHKIQTQQKTKEVGKQWYNLKKMRKNKSQLSGCRNPSWHICGYRLSGAWWNPINIFSILRDFFFSPWTTICHR